MTENKLRILENRVYNKLSDMQSNLEELAKAASEILGFEVIADICNGSEIEFRTRNDRGYVEDSSCIRMEDVIRKLKGS